MEKAVMDKGAEFDVLRKYRYRLWRVRGPGKRVCWISVGGEESLATRQRDRLLHDQHLWLLEVAQAEVQPRRRGSHAAARGGGSEALQ